jgi:hypothetical protein
MHFSLLQAKTPLPLVNVNVLSRSSPLKPKNKNHQEIFGFDVFTLPIPTHCENMFLFSMTSWKKIQNWTPFIYMEVAGGSSLKTERRRPMKVFFCNAVDGARSRSCAMRSHPISEPNYFPNENLHHFILCVKLRSKSFSF